MQSHHSYSTGTSEYIHQLDSYCLSDPDTPRKDASTHNEIGRKKIQNVKIEPVEIPDHAC